MAGILKIVITGPESSGKSELARHLGREFSVPVVPEFARIYLEKEGPDYDFELVSRLARQHWEFQQELILQAKEVIILDTDLINYEVWQQVVFHKVDPWITARIREESDHIYLITFPDLPWVPDPLRENAEGRVELFELHKAAVQSRERRFEVVRGTGERRFRNGQDLFKLFLKEYPRT